MVKVAMTMVIVIRLMLIARILTVVMSLWLKTQRAFSNNYTAADDQGPNLLLSPINERSSAPGNRCA